MLAPAIITVASLVITVASMVAQPTPRYHYTRPCLQGDRQCVKAALAFERLDARCTKLRGMRLVLPLARVVSDVRKLVDMLNAMRKDAEVVVNTSQPEYKVMTYARLGIAFDYAAGLIQGAPEPPPDSGTGLDKYRRDLKDTAALIRDQARDFLGKAARLARQHRVDNAVTAPAMLLAVKYGVAPHD